MKLIFWFIDVIAGIIAWLLKALGLWVPLVFCVGFFAVCIATATPFNDVAILFILGLTFSLFCSALIVIYRPINYIKKMSAPRRMSAPATIAPVRRKEEYRLESQPMQKRKEQAQEYEQPFEQPTKKAKKQAATQQSFWINNASSQPQNMQSGFAPQMQEGINFNPQSNYNAQGYLNGGYMLNQQAQPSINNPPYKPVQFKPSPAPMIFRTRVDPSLLIYEYPDRVEVYRRTNEGLKLISVEYNS